MVEDPWGPELQRQNIPLIPKVVQHLEYDMVFGVWGLGFRGFRVPYYKYTILYYILLDCYITLPKP